jgi:diaminopimelate decarboxylase
MATLNARLSHVLPLGSAVNERGHLEIGGCDAIELAHEFGTPAYVVAEDDLRARASAFVEALSSRHTDYDVLFATKAFACTAVCRTFAEAGLGCEVASAGELYLALRGGFDPARIYLHGNAKTEHELLVAMRSGVGHVVLDSDHELDRAERIAGQLDLTQKVLIRVTPGVAGDTHQAISTGQSDSKFGFSPAAARAAAARLAGSHALELVGLHCHIGSQLFELDPFRAAVRTLATLGQFPVYNLGGGLAAPYTAEQHPPAVEDYVDALVGVAHELLGADKRLLLEPGRALVASSTVTLYTVQSVKRNVSTWVAVDGGMSDNLRPMLYGAVYEPLIADRPLARGTDRCHLAGKHCESGDVIARDLSLADPLPGDVIVVPATGAYGHSLANGYNGALRPPVIFCRDGAARVVVRRETCDDLVIRDAR